MQNLQSCSEIAPLRRVLVHTPDAGLGYVPANKMEEWLYDDIVDLRRIRLEYEAFHTLLLLFLNPDKLFLDGKFALNEQGKIRREDGKRLLETNPEKEDYYVHSHPDEARVVDTQYLLQYGFEANPDAAFEMLISICAIEELHPSRITDLRAMLTHGKKDAFWYRELVKTLLSGKLVYEAQADGPPVRLPGNRARYLFAPIPNFIFTRDIGVTIGDHLLITKPKFYIRKREVQLMRFISEQYLCAGNPRKLIQVSEDDDFFQIEEKNQPEHRVSYEGGDIMMISDRHVLMGCSERTSPYAIQKLVHRLFWEPIKTGNDHGVEYVTVVKIGAKRSQMHIDTVFTHVREDVWALHAPLSEVWREEQRSLSWQTRHYNDELYQKSAKQVEREKDLELFQFYLHSDGKQIKADFQKEDDPERKQALKEQFKQLDFMLRPDKTRAYANAQDSLYTHRPKGLHDLLTQISVKEFGVSDGSKVKFVLSGMGIPPFEGREQWTDACNLFTLRSGVSVGYDRNPKTIVHFNEIMANEATIENLELVDHMVRCNRDRFRDRRTSTGEEIDLDHVLHVRDLFRFVVEKGLNAEQTKALIAGIKNTLILLPSDELSRARGGAHCMTMPLVRG